MNAQRGAHVESGDSQTRGKPVSSQLSATMLNLRWEQEVMQRMWKAGYRRRLFTKVVTAHRQMEDQKRALRASGKIGSWVKWHTLPIYDAPPGRESNHDPGLNLNDGLANDRDVPRFGATDSDQRRTSRRSQPGSGRNRHYSDRE